MAGGEATYKSISQSFSYILRKEGLLSFWNGNGANVIRILPNYGLRFSLNDKAREFVLSASGAQQLSSTQLFFAGSLAGLGQISLTYPGEVVFTRLTLAGSDLGVRYRGIAHCVRDMIRAEGVRSLYNGYLATLLVGTPYVALQMSSNEVYRRWMTRVRGKELGTLEKLTAGAVAVLTAQTLTFPGDVVRKRLQSDGMGGKPRVYQGLLHAIKTIFRNEGWRGFFDGARVNTWRCLPEGAIMFVVFDSMKQALDIQKYDPK